ncbi:MAG: aminoglycoside phosphotransferase family protein [Gammaproteobacteria bacterium]|nr:aminoglycoside phosphotransferase family protein [Gammaproteobacteria bacterium]
MRVSQIARDEQAFQQPVDEQALRAALQRELSKQQVTSVTELPSGMFNNAYRVSTDRGAYALKIAPVAGAEVFYNERFLMQRERAMATSLTSCSALVPRYLSFFTVDDREAFLQPWVEGELWHEISGTLSDAENDRLWRQLGEFARRLHSCSGSGFGYPGPFSQHDRWSAFIADNVAGMAEDSRRLNVMTRDIEVYQRHIEAFAETLNQVSTPKLLHGDLWPRNVIVRRSEGSISIVAVIDGERAFWGDPLSDWVLLLYGVPQAFWEGYGENLLNDACPVRSVVYRGMYALLNILETVRFAESPAAPRQRLAAVNHELNNLS